MNGTLSIQKIRHEARLMFSLIDAFECSKPARVAAALPLWREAKKRVNATGDYEKEATVFYEILIGLDESGAFTGTWIEARWRASQSRIAEDQ